MQRRDHDIICAAVSVLVIEYGEFYGDSLQKMQFAGEQEEDGY